jgi:hypothetical protein
VVASVHIEAAWDRADDPLAEIEWLETLDKSSGVAARYIGFADLTAPDAVAALDRLSEVNRCVGVRQMLSWHPVEPARSFAPRPGIANEAHFRRGVGLLARHDQLLESMLYPYGGRTAGAGFPQSDLQRQPLRQPDRSRPRGYAAMEGRPEATRRSTQHPDQDFGADRVRSEPHA